MSPGEIPNERSLKADIARVEPLIDVPFGRFLDDQALLRLGTSKDRAVLANVMRRHFVELDWRIRFVKAAPDGSPDATMKLAAVDKAIRFAKGWRLLRLLDGGVVAVAVKKKGPPKEWRIVALKRFLPAGLELERHENDIESLLRLYLRNQDGKKFPATSVGAFQIRTGPAIHDLYLKAHDYFAGLDGAKR